MRVSIRTNDAELRLCAFLGERYGERDNVGAEMLAEVARALVAGDRCEADPVEALRIWRALALSGDAAAMASLGRHYQAAGDSGAARAWLSSGAAGGDAVARGSLISMLARSGDPDDMAEAWGWMVDALRWGDPVEREFLARHLPSLVAATDPALIDAAPAVGRSVN